MKKFKNNSCLNNKGFAITSIIYAMLLLFIVLMMLTIATLGRKKNLLDKSREDAKVILSEFYQTFDYDYTGDVQTFVAPRDGYYKIELWGAQGGTQGSNSIGGKGAYTQGQLYLENGDELYIYIGENPGEQIKSTFGGGSIGTSVSGSGGGATDVRLSNGDWDDFNSLKTRIMVAAGGGGNSNYGFATNGGSGGTLIGDNGNISPSNSEISIDGIVSSTGGNQTVGGVLASVSDCVGGTNGSFGIAGTSCSYINETGVTITGGGSGGGYYGGGGSGANSSIVTSGAGGSSFISGYDGCKAIKQNSTASNIIHEENSIHYSSLQFVNSNMIDGNSYMPTYNAANIMIGNSGNGHAKITYIGSLVSTEKVNLEIIDFNTLDLPTINDNNFSISASSINYRLDLLDVGYSFDWNWKEGSGSLKFCNVNDDCVTLLSGNNSFEINGNYVTSEPGYLLLSLNDATISVNNLVFKGEKVKINQPILKSPKFSVKSNCVNVDDSFNCSTTNKSGDTVEDSAYIFASNQGNWVTQFNVDNSGEWVDGIDSVNGYYFKISGSGEHTVKLRNYYANLNLYSEESKEFIIKIK